MKATEEEKKNPRLGLIICALSGLIVLLIIYVSINYIVESRKYPFTDNPFCEEYCWHVEGSSWNGDINSTNNDCICIDGSQGREWN